MAILLTMALIITSCGGGGGGGGGTPDTGGGGDGGGGTTPATTTISGKVTLSSTVSKPSYKSLGGAPMGRPGSDLYLSTLPTSGLNKTFMATDIPLNNADVWLYDADHPEWLAPIAETTADANGDYTLSTLTNAALNNGAYTEGALIPAGKYTLVAWKFTLGSKPLVATQTIVNKYENAVTGTNLVAQPSDAAPTVRTMFGFGKNTDGTQSWGNSTSTFPTNAAIQISFSMAMWRDNLSSIKISPAISGHWTLSPDWTTATFYPDAGVTLAANTVYTVTVTGADQATTLVPAVTNVYGNAVALTAVGTFKTASGTDTLAPTGVWLSPTVVEMGSPVDVTKPIRIGSNKVLDINSLLLEGTPSLGAKPGVLFVGKDNDGYYVYEFALGTPLQLGTNYTLKVSGGKDLAGNVMMDLNGSLGTISASLSSGITATADTTTQNAQAQVKDVFGKWVRGFNDRNLAQIQSVMSGEFYMEYDTSQYIDNRSDVNRDGKYSIKEFSDMLSNDAFTQWQYCGTSITGEVIGDINVVGDTADFEFKLSATSTVALKECADAAPKDSLYTTLKKINGAWVIIRASEGIDTRDRPIVNPAKVNIYLKEGTTTIANGGKLSTAVAAGTTPATFSWDAVSNVSTYVVILVDARNPGQGMAFALPSTMTSISTDKDPISVGAKDVSCKFGFCEDGGGGPSNSPGGSTGGGGGGNGPFAEGGQYYWEVIGLGSIGINTIGNDPKTDPTAPKTSDIIADIMAISSVNNFSVDGIYKEITVTVTAAGSTTPLVFNENFDGFDAGGADSVTIKVHTMNPDLATNMGCAGLNVNGSGSQNYPLTFTNGDVTVTAQLYRGWSNIGIWDCAGLGKSFRVQTTGGIPPVISITSVVDDLGQALSKGTYGDYYNSKDSATFKSGSKKLTITGAVLVAGLPVGSTLPNLNVNVWNESQANYYAQAPVDYSSGNGTFTVTVEIFQGDNWLNLGGSVSSGTGGSMGNGYNANMGVYTDTGSVYVPPFGNVTVWSTTTTTLSPTKSYGNSTEWDATGDSDYTVTVTGRLKKPIDGTYWINSEGSNSNGTLKAMTDGSFSLTVELFTGWNNVSMNDADGNWYGLNIYITLGKQVMKATISTINGDPYTAPTGGMGTASVTTCSATIVGQALVGDVNVNWNGYDGSTSHSEWQTVKLTGTEGTLGTFTVTVPIVGGAGNYNYVDINDANYKWTGISITGPASGCAYQNPAVTLTEVRNSDNVPLTVDTYGNYDAGAYQTITVIGTTNRPGRTINAHIGVCGLNDVKSATADTTETATGSGLYSWTITGIPVYDSTNSGSTWINIDGGNYQSNISFGVNSSNGIKPTPPITVSAVSSAVKMVNPYGGCGDSQWDATSGTTSVQQVTITGSTTAPAGTGNYMDSTGGNHQFTINADSTFSITVDVYDGWNYVSINDSAWNYAGVSIQTANARPKPQFVTITSPTNGATGITGVQNVTGTIIDANASGYIPSRVYAWVNSYDPLTGTSTSQEYSSDPRDQMEMNKKPITFDGSSFSFQLDFGAGTQFTIGVNAYDEVTWTGHGHNIDVNTLYPGTGYYYKARVAPSSSGNQYLKQESLKQYIMIMSKDR